MRTVKRLLGFMLAAGLMISAMVVFADDSGSGNGESIPDHSSYEGTVESNKLGGSDFIGSQIPNWYSESNRWFNTSNNQWYRSLYTLSGWAWVPMPEDSKDSGETERIDPYAEAVAIAQQAEAEAVQHAASDEGFADVGDMYRASQKSMSAGEFYNNAVVSTPGIENTVTVGQGGNLVVNGQVTNMSATISKVTNRAYVDSVRIEQEGRVLNVVDVSYPATEATINFYMPGVTAEDAIVALQYNAGTWVEVEVAEVRADHVTLNMKGNGVVAFIAK